MSPRFALLLALFAPLTLGCTCFTPSLPRQYHDPATVNFVRATVLSRSNAGIGIRFTLFVTRNFKGCDPILKIITVDTPASSAACGTNLQLFRSYVLPVRAGPNPSLFLCDVRITNNYTYFFVSLYRVRPPETNLSSFSLSPFLHCYAVPQEVFGPHYRPKVFPGDARKVLQSRRLRLCQRCSARQLLQTALLPARDRALSRGYGV